MLSGAFRRHRSWWLVKLLGRLWSAVVLAAGFAISFEVGSAVPIKASHWLELA